MTKVKSKIPAVLITISSGLTLILLVFLKSKFSTPANYQPVNPTINSPSPTFVPTTYNIPSSSPSPSPKNLKKETIHRENPNKTLAFYYASDDPAFSDSEQGSSRDPFKLALNGDTTYFTQSAANKGWDNDDNPISIDSYQAIVKPKVIDLITGSARELYSLDKGMITGNGAMRVIRWINNTTLLSQSSWEGGAELNFIDVIQDKSSLYADTSEMSLPSYSGTELVIHLQNYYFVQTNVSSVRGEIRVYKDVGANQVEKQGGGYDFDGLVPIVTLKTSRSLGQLELDDQNVATLNRIVRLYLYQTLRDGQEFITDGYFDFDLQSGSVLEVSNL